MQKVSRPPQSGFTENLLSLNSLDLLGFAEWFFSAGMEFHSSATWWGEKKKRGHPHEGVDLYWFTDRGGQRRNLPGHALVPVMYDGKIVGVVDDFLEQTLVVAHDYGDAEGRRLHTLYGHTQPASGMSVGTSVQAGDAIAAVGQCPTRKSSAPPHLHLSMVWLEQDFPARRLNWETIHTVSGLLFSDPLGSIAKKAGAGFL